MKEHEVDRAARHGIEGRIVLQADRFKVGDGPWQDNDGNAVADPLQAQEKPRTLKYGGREWEMANPRPFYSSHQPLVILESPLAGDVDANMAYARACLLDSLQRGESPIASHLLHTQVLDDTQPTHRTMGIEAGLAWYRVADKCVVYTDRGISGGMRAGIERADEYGVDVEYRQLESGEGQVAA